MTSSLVLYRVKICFQKLTAGSSPLGRGRLLSCAMLIRAISKAHSARATDKNRFRENKTVARFMALKLTHASKRDIFSQNILAIFSVIKTAAQARVLLLILSISVLACRGFSPVQTLPDYITVGIESNPTRLDPRYATDANSARIGSLIYNSLLRVDENGHLRGDLAENWSLIDDRTYSFQIRRGVTFHDGRPLTAADVKFTYDSILEPRNRSPKRAPLK